jgi:cytohesin
MDASGTAAFFTAVRKGDHKMVSKLLDANSSLVKERDAVTGETPLFLAAERGLDLIVRRLLKSDASIVDSAALGRKWTALHAAAYNGSSDVVRALTSSLFAAGLPECHTFVDADGRNALHIAAQYGRYQAFDAIAPDAKRYSLFHTGDRRGRTPLYLAARGGHDTSVLLLLKLSASVETPNSRGESPLHAAVKAGNSAMVTLLTTRGSANPNVADCDGSYPLHVAAAMGDSAVLRSVIAAKPSINARDAAGMTAVGVAVSSARAKIMACRIAHDNESHTGPPPQPTRSSWNFCARPQSDSDGISPHDALPHDAGINSANTAVAGSGCSVPYMEDEDEHLVGAVPKLFEKRKGFDSCRDADVWVSRYADCIKLLCAAGCSANIADWKGISPLYHACDLCVPMSIIEALLVGGADPSGPPAPDGSSALLIAAERSNAAAVERLIDGGADVNARRKNGSTALHAVTWLEDAAMVRLLAKRGADVNSGNNGGWTPLFVAAFKPHRGMCDLLLDLGADASWRDNNGCTAADILSRLDNSTAKSEASEALERARTGRRTVPEPPRSSYCVVA